MSTGNRCLARLEELTLENELQQRENEILRTENRSLKQVVKNQANENKRYRDTITKLNAALEEWCKTK